MKFPSFKKKKFTEKDDDPSRLEIKPYRDWRIIFSVFFVLLVISVAVHIYVFLRVGSGTIFKVPQEEVTNEEILKVDLLNEVTDHFDAKARRMEALLGEGLTP